MSVCIKHEPQIINNMNINSSGCISINSKTINKHLLYIVFYKRPPNKLKTSA